LGRPQDWNDAANWYDPATGAAPEYAPSKCTDILIPDGLVIYPDLTPGITDYTQQYYETASCADIWFEHGGEVARTDSLDYEKAHVELGMRANQWYMFSAPLQNFYTGDIYLTNPCPFDDKVVMYTQLFNKANPQTTVGGTSWTGAFNTASHRLSTGTGTAIWADAAVGGVFTDDFTNHANVLTPVATFGSGRGFWFPKPDTFYKYYFDYTNNWTGNQTGTLDRTNAHRFIYEECAADGLGNITVPVSAGANEVLLVGNPFMAHLDFDRFYAANSAKIEKEYKVIRSTDTDPVTEGGIPDFVSYVYASTGALNEVVIDPVNMGNLIPPMQSVILTAKAGGFTDLTFNGSMTVTRPGDKLKAAGLPDYTVITAKMGTQKSVSVLLYAPAASNSYIAGEDSRKLYSEKIFDNVTNTVPLVLYTSSSDGVPLEVNTFGDITKSIKLCLRTSLTGEIRLDFSDLEHFSNINVFLHDLAKGAGINLKETPSYTFTKESAQTELSDRFLLTFSKVTTGLSTPESSIAVFTRGSQLQIVSSDDIRRVEVIDMQGRKILTETNTGGSVFTHDLPSNAMYVVKVLTGKGLTTRKVTTD
jgi:hypothetical protein